MYQGKVGYTYSSCLNCYISCMYLVLCSPQGAFVHWWPQLVAPLPCHQLLSLHLALLPHHPCHHHLHHGQVQRHQTRGVPKCKETVKYHVHHNAVWLWGSWFCHSSPPYFPSVSVPPEPHHHSVLPHPAVVVLLGPSPHHRLLLCLLWGPLDTVQWQTLYIDVFFNAFIIYRY